MTNESFGFSKYKSWKITYALPWGGLLFVAGFAMREASVFNIHNLDDFIAYQVLLLLAPSVLSPASAFSLLTN